MARKKGAKRRDPSLTEAGWLTSEDPAVMVDWLLSEQAGVPRLSDRKLRLIACECLRSIWQYLNPQNRTYVEWQQTHPDEAPAKQSVLRGSKWAEYLRAPAGQLVHIIDVTREGALSKGGGNPPARQADLLREFVGNPFKPVTVSPAWLTADVLRLAADAYESRALEQLPILADALEDAGCDSAELLAHLHGPGPHVRGCWALDQILGKE
jgi:hypothetical protein